MGCRKLGFSDKKPMRGSGAPSLETTAAARSRYSGFIWAACTMAPRVFNSSAIIVSNSCGEITMGSAPSLAYFSMISREPRMEAISRCSCVTMDRGVRPGASNPIQCAPIRSRPPFLEPL